MDETRVVMHQIVMPMEVDALGICFGGQVSCFIRPELTYNSCKSAAKFSSVRFVSVTAAAFTPISSSHVSTRTVVQNQQKQEQPWRHMALQHADGQWQHAK